MSIFYCHRCDELADADDGCDEVDGELICVECAELEEDEDDVADAPSGVTATVVAADPGRSNHD
jgi:hypothetical protein